jgi:hypothetical protein
MEFIFQCAPAMLQKHGARGAAFWIIICVVMYCCNHRFRNPTQLEDATACHNTRLFETSNKLAVMIEPRKVPNLLLVIDNFIKNLPADWRMHLFLSRSNVGLVLGAHSLQQWLACRRISVSTYLHVHKYPEDYNKVLLSAEFWKSLPGEHILIFQTDSVLCSASPHSIDDFLQYDYVGARWASAPHLPCGNGGLSLRRKDMVLKVLHQRQAVNFSIPEDVWYCEALMTANATLPAPNVSNAFAVESNFHAMPLGMHKFYAFQQGLKRQQLLTYCPEARILLPLRWSHRVTNWLGMPTTSH